MVMLSPMLIVPVRYATHLRRRRSERRGALCVVFVERGSMHAGTLYIQHQQQSAFRLDGCGATNTYLVTCDVRTTRSVARQGTFTAKLTTNSRRPIFRCCCEAIRVLLPGFSTRKLSGGRAARGCRQTRKSGRVVSTC